VLHCSGTVVIAYYPYITATPDIKRRWSVYQLSAALILPAGVVIFVFKAGRLTPISLQRSRSRWCRFHTTGNEAEAEWQWSRKQKKMSPFHRQKGNEAEEQNKTGNEAE
jgi:hypothetical protein